MSIEENKAVIRRQVEDVWNSSNADAIATYWEKELGVEMERSHTMLHTAFPDLKVSVVDMIAENDKVVARLLFEGTQKGFFMGIPPTGKKVGWEAMRIWRLANGKIVETWAIRDRLDVREQLGVIPSQARGKMKNQTSSSFRATTIEELEIVLDKFFDETKTPLGLAFKPRPSDSLSHHIPKAALPGCNKSLTGCELEAAWISTRLTTLSPGLKLPMMWAGI